MFMKKSKALMAVLLLSMAGLAFSGYMSYNEIVGGTCATGGCSSLMGIPTCVYGFVMYLLIFAVALKGVMSRD
jgi:hypothetical protein